MNYDETAKMLRDMYREAEIQYRPDLRWWLAEGLNTDATLRKNVREIHDLGFGAAEFLAMPEPGADSSIYGWGSDEWTSDTRLIIGEATKLGLGFSLTSGAHWANANLPDTYVWQGEPYNPDNVAAAKELDYVVIRLKPGESRTGALPLPEKPVSGAEEDSIASDIHATNATYSTYQFQGVVAAKIIKPRREAETGVLSLQSLTDLSESVQKSGEDYTLDYRAPADGEYALFVYWMHGTGQTASPSVSTNYTINYVDRYGTDALIEYWENVVLTGDLKRTIRENGRGEIYMDSLELHTYGAGGLFWGYHLKDEFQRRMGYDITRYLPITTSKDVRVAGSQPTNYDYMADNAADNALVRKVRSDLYSVLSAMYEENVLRPLQTWLHSLNMTLRAEPSYGMPYEISTPARYIDGIETESFAQVADVDLYRGMSGAAHMYGRLFSSETGAVPGRNYCYSMDDWTQLCLLQFAAGVNRTVFHGFSAIEGSEADTYWPGHEGMYAVFSERFGSRQPASIHYPAWTGMLARNQKALRQGVPARDIAILRTDYAFINYGQPEGHSTFSTNLFMHDKLHFFSDLSLQRAGYTYDYFSPRLLEDEANTSWTARELMPNGPAYRAVILYQEEIELSAAQKLLEIARGGFPILFVNNNEEIVAYAAEKRLHKKAASTTRHLGDDEAALQKVIAEIKALPNVLEVDSPKDALAALSALGIAPRAAYASPNDKILTASRRDANNGLFYTFAYSYKFEVEKDAGPCAFTLSIEGEGTPYQIDAWTGEVNKLGLYEVKDGRTHIPMELIPGESSLIALDLKSPAAPSSGGADAAALPAIPLTHWDITLEDWNEGERIVNTEEKFGHVTKEVYYTTKKTILTFPNCTLRPWKDLPATEAQKKALAGRAPSLSHVSGTCVYETTFTLPGDWPASRGATLSIESAGGGTVAVQINGSAPRLVDTRTLKTDISALVRGGENTVRIEVTSTLTNRMIQRDYASKKSGWNESFPTVQAYGLSGDVRIVFH